MAQNTRETELGKTLGDEIQPALLSVEGEAVTRA